MSQEANPETSALICPRCGKEVPMIEPFWSFFQKFYCSQECAQLAARLFAL